MNHSFASEAMNNKKNVHSNFRIWYADTQTYTLISYTWYFDKPGTGNNFILLFLRQTQHWSYCRTFYEVEIVKISTTSKTETAMVSKIKQAKPIFSGIRHHASGIWITFKWNGWATGGDDATKCYLLYT